MKVIKDDGVSRSYANLGQIDDGATFKLPGGNDIYGKIQQDSTCDVKIIRFSNLDTYGMCPSTEVVIVDCVLHWR